MAFNLRGSQPIADGSITEAKLANNAVTSDKIASNAVIESKIASDAVTETKIVDSAISTNKLADSAVDINKIEEVLTNQHFFGTEVELFNTGTTETSVGEFNFHSDSTSVDQDWKHLSYSAKLKTDNIANTASIKIYVDGSQVGTTQSTTSTTYEVISEYSLPLTGIVDGNHLVEIKLVNSAVSGITTLGQIDTYLARK